MHTWKAERPFTYLPPSRHVILAFPPFSLARVMCLVAVLVQSRQNIVCIIAPVNGIEIINAKKYSRQAIILLLLFHCAHIQLSLFVFYLFIVGLYCIARCTNRNEAKRKEKKNKSVCGRVVLDLRVLNGGRGVSISEIDDILPIYWTFHYRL